MRKLHIEWIGRFVAAMLAMYCFVCAPSAAMAAETVYGPGDKGSAVSAIQRDLATLGYHQIDNSTDGEYDKNMEEAVRRFQQHYNLEKTGKVDKKTRTRLSDYASTVRKAHEKEGVPELFDGCYQVIEIGSKHKCIKALQSALKKLGYSISKIDGTYGASTKKAVEEFQRDNKLYVDGKAGVMTLLAVERSIKALGGMESADASMITRTLRYKDKGDDVTYLQARLIELGYLKGSVSGNYRSTTRDAVKAFQKKAGLKANGICDASTVAALFDDKAPKAGK